MNRYRLRGTWEDDPAPIPFPGTRPGRQAGGTAEPQRHAQAADADIPSTDELIDSVDSHLDRISYKIDELRQMLSPFDGETDPPPAA